MDRPVESLADPAQDIQPREPVVVGEEDVLAAVTAGGDVVQTTGEFDSEGTGHGRMLLQSVMGGKT
jgi:hypothetical protein